MRPLLHLLHGTQVAPHSTSGSQDWGLLSYHGNNRKGNGCLILFLSKQSNLLEEKSHILFRMTSQPPMFTFSAQFTAPALGRMLEWAKKTLWSSVCVIVHGNAWGW